MSARIQLLVVATFIAVTAAGITTCCQSDTHVDKLHCSRMCRCHFVTSPFCFWHCLRRRCTLINICCIEVCGPKPAVSCTGVAAEPVLGNGFVVAASGERCEATCSGAAQKPGFLNSFYTGDSTYMCAANIDDEAWVPGYQTTEPHCSATYKGNTVNATSYACLCLSPEQTPGLEPSTGGQSCEQTCQQVLQGQVGTAVKTDADVPLYACLPTSEAGKRNRFGVANDQSVPYTQGAVASDMAEAAGVTPLDDNTISCNSAALSSTTDYSCFCTFEPLSGSSSSSSSANGGGSSSASSSAASSSSSAGSSMADTSSISTAGRKLLR